MLSRLVFANHDGGAWDCIKPPVLCPRCLFLNHPPNVYRTRTVDPRGIFTLQGQLLVFSFEGAAVEFRTETISSLLQGRHDSYN